MINACPFCANDRPLLYGMEESARVRCATCGTMGPIYFFTADNDAEIDHAERAAVDAWNAARA